MIDSAQALHKWRPILETLKITDEKLQRYAATYAEHHSQLDTAAAITTNDEANLLPLSLLLFSKLNLQNKHFGVLESPNHHTFRTENFCVDCEVETLEDFSVIVDYLQEKERGLVDEMAAALNEKLQEYNTLLVYRLVKSLRIGDGKLRLVSRVAFKNTK